MDVRIFPDINNFTERFQAHQVRAAGALVIGVLASDGESFVSPSYAQQVAHAHEAHLQVWHYHFCRPESDPNAIGEMGHFWKTVRGHYKRGDRLVLDVERNHPAGPMGLVKYVHRCDHVLHQLSGIHQVTYMPDSLFRSCGSGLQTLSKEFWIASWGGRVARLGAGRRMIAQQINDGQDGYPPLRYPGIGSCDMNRLQLWYTRRLMRQRKELHL